MTFEIKNTYYTTLDRQATFCFDFVQTAGGDWHIYIVQQPPYNGRPEGATQSHRLTDARGRYICWVPGPRTLDQAKGVARAWADATYEYIQSGSFPGPGPEREVPDVSTSASWALREHVGVIHVPQLAQPAPRINNPRAQSNLSGRARPTQLHEPMQTESSWPAGMRGLFSRWRNNS